MSSQVFTQSAEALGTTVVLQLVADTQGSAETLFERLWQSVEEFEKRFSRFLSDSELTTVNQSAGERVIVSKEFCDLAQQARNFSLATKGAFNPFMLPAVQQAGYVRSIHERTAEQPALNYTDRDITTVEQLEVGGGWVKISSNTALDFGAIGKGYLADQLASLCDSLPGYCLSIGGDMAIAGSPPGQTGWAVGVENAEDRGQDIATVKAGYQAYGVATSGQKRIRGDRSVVHSVNAKTRRPLTSGAVSATVLAADATTADVYAGVALQTDPDDLERLCKNATLYAVMQQYNDGSLRICGDGIVSNEGDV